MTIHFQHSMVSEDTGVMILYHIRVLFVQVYLFVVESVSSFAPAGNKKDLKHTEVYVIIMEGVCLFVCVSTITPEVLNVALPKLVWILRGNRRLFKISMDT